MNGQQILDAMDEWLDETIPGRLKFQSAIESNLYAQLLNEDSPSRPVYSCSVGKTTALCSNLDFAAIIRTITAPRGPAVERLEAGRFPWDWSYP